MKEYMSDKELDEFINDIENEQIEAPFYLKKEILRKAFPKSDETVVEYNNLKEHNRMKNNTKRNKKQFCLYTFKVCASVAAAIVLLFLIPDISDKSVVDTKKYNSVIEESMGKVSNGFNNVFDKFSKISYDEFLDIGK